MFTLAPFSQSVMLRGETDPEIQQGVCVALCDFWLEGIQKAAGIAGAMRMQVLAANFASIAAYQKQYARERAAAGPEKARRDMGQTRGLDYQQQTTITKAYMSSAEIRQKLASDLGAPRAAATWSMRFLAGGGHAIAGFRFFKTTGDNMHFPALYLFDPNIGEYEGALSDIDDMLRDLLNHFPEYRRISEIRRTTDQ